MRTSPGKRDRVGATRLQRTQLQVGVRRGFASEPEQLEIKMWIALPTPPPEKVLGPEAVGGERRADE